MEYPDEQSAIGGRINQLSQGATNSSKRIESISAMASECVTQSEVLVNRLYAAVERLDGSRPEEAMREKDVDPPGILGDIDRKLRITLTQLNSAHQWLNDLESMI